MKTTKKKNGKRPKQKWKTNQSTKINLIGCDTIVNSPSLIIYGFSFYPLYSYFTDCVLYRGLKCTIHNLLSLIIGRTHDVGWKQFC